MDTNRHQFPEKEATKDCTDNTDKTIKYPPKTPKDAKGSGSVVRQFLASFCVFGGPLWSTHIRSIRVSVVQPPNEANEVFSSLVTPQRIERF